jgi:hypothetical protein
MPFIIVMLLFLSPASAKEFPVNDQDQQAVLAICDVAAQNPTATTADQVRTMRAQISGWCVKWQDRMKEAEHPDNKDPPPAK